MGHKIGLIGLGEMGTGMGKNLLKKGFDLTVYHPRSEVMDQFLVLGARKAGSPCDLAAMTDVVLSMVRDDAQTEEVMWGDNGVLKGIRNGSTIIVTSTVSPGLCQRLAKEAAKNGVGVLDSPVSGAKAGAEAGTLTLMVGGDSEVVKEMEPVLRAIGANLFHLGPIGMGEVGKLANNMVLFGSMAVTTEALAFATKAGIRLKTFINFVNVSTGVTWVSQKWDTVAALKKERTPKATLNILYKDLEMGLACAREAGVEVPIISKLGEADLWREVV